MRYLLLPLIFVLTFGCAKSVNPHFGGADALGRATARIDVIEQTTAEKQTKQLSKDAKVDLGVAANQINELAKTRDTALLNLEKVKSSIGYRTEQFCLLWGKWWIGMVLFFISLRFAAIWLSGTIGTWLAWVSTFALHFLFGFVSLPLWIADNIYFRKKKE